MTYRPEFLNRLDELVLFEPLRKSTLRSICRLSLDVTDAALDVLTDLGYSPEYGARPLKRVVQKELETPIARGLIAGDVVEGDTVHVTADMDEISLKITVKERAA